MVVVAGCYAEVVLCCYDGFEIICGEGETIIGAEWCGEFVVAGLVWLVVVNGVVFGWIDGLYGVVCVFEYGNGVC